MQSQVCQLPSIINKSAFAFAAYINGAFQIFIQLSKTCNFITGLLYNSYIIFGLTTKAGSLFVLHLNIFCVNNPAKQKPLTIIRGFANYQEGLVQHCICAIGADEY